MTDHTLSDLVSVMRNYKSLQIRFAAVEELVIDLIGEIGEMEVENQDLVDLVDSLDREIAAYRELMGIDVAEDGNSEGAAF